MVKNPTSKIIWLASYPKSGNTWVRFLLFNLIFGKPENTVQLENWIPDIHNSLSGYSEVTVDDILYSETALVKTHFMFSILDTPKLRLLLQQTVGFIYIVRNPLDVMFSNLNYSLLSAYQILRDEETLGKYISSYIDSFLKNKGHKRWIEMGFGNWETHIQSWLDSRNNLPNLVVRYEDLIRDTYSEVKRLSDFLELESDEDLIRQAISNSSFSALKKLEENAVQNRERGIFYHPAWESAQKAGIHFMNKGEVGEGKRELSSEQIERAINTFEPFMKKFNYI